MSQQPEAIHTYTPEWGISFILCVREVEICSMDYAMFLFPFRYYFLFLLYSR